MCQIYLLAAENVEGEKGEEIKEYNNFLDKRLQVHRPASNLNR